MLGLVLVMLLSSAEELGGAELILLLLSGVSGVAELSVEVAGVVRVDV